MSNWSGGYFLLAKIKREEKKGKCAAIGSISRDIDLKVKAITIKSFC